MPHMVSLAMLGLVGVVATEKPNMNGAYVVASGDRQSVSWNDNYASKGYEYFDVWAPEIATHYAEVFWTDQHNQPLPPDIVERFKDKTIAIVGYEQDQVMVSPVGSPGVNPDLDVSVPINWAYNHHYMTYMTGAHSEMVRVLRDHADAMAHGETHKWEARDTPSAAFRADPTIPTSQFFSEGNGGESRKSFHGYPATFAQLVDNPQTWHITPMQIDTRNRDCGVTPADIGNCTKFTPGVEPRQARYGRGIPAGGTNYSGILECPCNGRYGGDPIFYDPAGQTKVIDHQYAAQTASCGSGQHIVDPKSCFTAMASLGLGQLTNKTIDDTSQPAGCFVQSATSNGPDTAFFNSAHSDVQCETSAKLVGDAKVETLGVSLSLMLGPEQGPVKFSHTQKGHSCEHNKVEVLASFQMTTTGADEGMVQLGLCEDFCANTTECWGCSVDCNPPSLQCRWTAIPDCGTVMQWIPGIINGDISQKIHTGLATITVSGPADVWFGVGFDALAMADMPYALIVNSSGVSERQIGTCGTEADHCPGDELASSVTVIANTVLDNVRTVVLTRDMVGMSPKHYTFNAKECSLDFIAAVGSSAEFAYHAAHAVSVITYTNVDAPTCVCDLGAMGQLCEPGGKRCNHFVKDCVAEPAGDLLAQNNPTCTSSQYAGGLSCCGHLRIMLDADQEIRPELLRYHMKFRFWFQEYVPATTDAPASHSDLPRLYYQTESNAGEYDIPPAFALADLPIPGYPNWPLKTPTPGTNCTGTCPDGPDCKCTHTIHYDWVMSNYSLIYAGGHCHAPSCLGLYLYRTDTEPPTLLCAQLPQYGGGNVTHNKFDEAGFLVLPPCLWGNEAGLDPAPWLGPNTPMRSIKVNDNTHVGHFGEMASWQMRGVPFQV